MTDEMKILIFYMRFINFSVLLCCDIIHDMAGLLLPMSLCFCMVLICSTGPL